MGTCWFGSCPKKTPPAPVATPITPARTTVSHPVNYGSVHLENGAGGTTKTVSHAVNYGNAQLNVGAGNLNVD